MKKPTTIDEQVKILSERGLVINDVEYAKSFLNEVNYYRFSGYTKLFSHNDVFYTDTIFDNLVNIYNFDDEFRRLILKYVISIEVLVKTQIAYILSNNIGSLFYRDSNNFSNDNHFNDLSKEIEKKISRFSDEIFIRHYDNNELPIWVLVEVLSFSDISVIYANLKSEYQKMICDGYLHTNRRYLQSYLYSLTILRNACAHGGRIYGKFFPTSPKLLDRDRKKLEQYGVQVSGSSQRVFTYFLVILKVIVNKKMKKTLIWDLEKLFNKYQVNLNYIGFPKKWKEILFSFI